MNVADQTEDKKEIAYEILEYLNDNPRAQDTLEGIVTWWLLVRAIKHRITLVQEALAMLVHDELVIKYQGSDSQIRYKINPKKRRKISSLLRKRS